ncbi:MAG: glycosyltransferase family 2 protein [Ktedonobacteraceae bacterium]
MKHLSREKAEDSIATDEALSYVPMLIAEVELGQPLLPLSACDEETGRTYERALCLVRLHTQPLGMLELALDVYETPPNIYAQHIWNALGETILEHLQQDGLPPVTGLNAQGLGSAGTPLCIEERDTFFTSAPFVSVIVPTHERTEQLRSCLQSLLSLHYPTYEIIIVDNAPRTNATADFIGQTYRDVPCIRYICEERPGASEARNRGIMAARGEILAFTDDDAVVDPYWLIELVRAFSSADDVACVTGLVLPLELETPAQFWFEEYGGFSKNFSRRIFDMAQHYPELPLHPFTAGQFGSGVCMAFTRAFLLSVNGFDLALGPGVPARAGEDLALFFQAIMHGHTLVYTPAALLYHLHRRDYTSLRQQMYSYGVGLAAYLTKNICDTPRLLFDFASKVPYGLYFTLSNRSSKNKKKSSHYPKELTRLELAGMLYGPFAYVRQRWSMRIIRKAEHPIKTSNTSFVAQIAPFRRENYQRLLSQEEEQREKRRV